MKIIAHFQDVNLGKGHRGLGELAAEHDIDVNELSVGECVVFTNVAKTATKVLTCDGIIVHRKSHTTLTRDMVLDLPRYFGGNSFVLNRKTKLLLGSLAEKEVKRGQRAV